MLGTKKTVKLVRAGIIAGLYVVLSLVCLPIASSPVQLRISEGLTMLPLIYVEAVPALFVGCLLSNVLSGCVIYDVILGSLTTLLASVLTAVIGKTVRQKFLAIFLGGFFPVILNALLLPLIWLMYGVQEYVYGLQALILLLSQSISVYGIGIPVVLSLDKLRKKGVDFLS